MQYYGMSNKGKVRGNNEDFFHIPENENDYKLFIVADGMGGENAGEVASALAVSEAVVCFRDGIKNENDIPLLLRRAVNASNKLVYNTAKSSSEYDNMGTTLVCAYFDSNTVFVANVGDSRCYKLSNGVFKQISIDHSFVQEMLDKGLITEGEAKNHPNKNLITRAIGVDRFVNADIFNEPWEKGDMLLLASDGLSGMLQKSEIEDIVKGCSDCRDGVKKLIKAANAAGGKDNITAILISEV